MWVAPWPAGRAWESCRFTVLMLLRCSGVTTVPSKHAGFSLIELLIVVAVILVIAAIAIPNLLRSRMVANEASAVASVRSINTSQVVYQSSYNIGYAANLISLGDGGVAANCVPPAAP